MYEIPCRAVLQLLPSLFTPELAQTLTACPDGLSLTEPLPEAPSPNGGVTQPHNSEGNATLMLH